MVAKGSPEWLPSGWTVQYKIQKTGRKIKFYENIESGKSFYSKDDVIGYIRSMESQKPQATSRRIKTQSGNNPVQLTVMPNEHPEWLPNGWKVESKTRMSGTHVGSIYKCYIDPTTGSRFYSKPEVFRYLRTVKNKPCTLKERKTSNSPISKCQVVIEHYKDEDLPPGWIKEVKIRKKGTGVRKDYFYIDPKTGYVFRSKKDVFDYLESGEISEHAFKPKEGGNNDLELIDDKISHPSIGTGRKPKKSAPIPQHSAVEKKSKGSSSELPGDRLPQIALSQEVIRDSSEINEDHTESNGTVRSSPANNGVISTSASERHQEKALPEAENPESNKTVRGSSPNNGLISTSASESNRKKALLEAENPESNRIVGSLNNGLISTSASDLHQGKALPDAENPESNRTDRVSPNNGLISASASELHQEKAFSEVENPESDKTVRGSPYNGLISTSASGLRQEKALPEVEDPESNKFEVPLANTPSSNAAPELQQEKIMTGNVMGSSETTEPKTKRKYKKKKDINLPRRSSQRLAVLKAELSNAETREVPQDSNGNCFDGVSRDADLFMNADADKASQQLGIRPERGNEGRISNFVDFSLLGEPSNNWKTSPGCSLDAPQEHLLREKTEKMDEGETEAQLCVPIAEFWSDPCLEFAIKTLTGALPVENATATDGSVSCPPTLQGKSLGKRGWGSSMNKKTQVNKKSRNKKEITFSPQYPSINGLKPQLASGVMACKQAKLNSNETLLSFNVVDSGIFGEPPCKYGTERSNKADKHRENQMAPVVDQHQKLQTNESGTPLFPFGDSWSDPCLDFAFKTLTGAIPVDDSLGIQSFFEERLESSCSQKDGTLPLPDFGSPSTFQNDISSNFSGPETSVSGQHLSLDPFIENVGLPNCSGFASQQPCFDRNRTFKGR